MQNVSLKCPQDQDQVSRTTTLLSTEYSTAVIRYIDICYLLKKAKLVLVIDIAVSYLLILLIILFAIY